MAVEVGAAQQVQQLLPREERDLHVHAAPLGKVAVVRLARAFSGENEVDLLAVGRAADGLDEDLLILFARQTAGRDDEELVLEPLRTRGRAGREHAVDAV